jgi:hypothetical protein
MTTHDSHAASAAADKDRSDPGDEPTEPGADAGAAASMPDLSFFMLPAAWPDPVAHRKLALRSLGLSVQGVEELMRCARVTHPFDVALVRNLQQREYIEHNYPLQLLLKLAQDAEAAARSPFAAMTTKRF